MAADGTFPVQVIAKLLLIDERRIQQLVKEGWIPRAERGRYSLIESVQGYIKFLKETGREQRGGTEHTRLARAQAIKVEMENFRRMGELQVTAQVDETCLGLVTMMASAHEALPGRLASELAAINEAPRIYQRLQSELRGVRDQCSDYLEQRADTLGAMQAPGPHDEATAPATADELGGTKPGDAER